MYEIHKDVYVRQTGKKINFLFECNMQPAQFPNTSNKLVNFFAPLTGTFSCDDNCVVVTIVTTMSSDSVEEKDKVVIVIVSGHQYSPTASTYIFPVEDFDSYFVQDPKQVGTIVPTTIDKHLICNCRRFDSFLCNHEVNHAKGIYDYGKQDLLVQGIYFLNNDNNMMNVADQVHPYPWLQTDKESN